MYVGVVKKREWSAEEIAGVTMLAALLFAVGLGAVGFYVGRTTKGSAKAPAPGLTQTETSVGTIDPHVAAGAHDFVQFACAQCHGAAAVRGGVSPDVPALTTAGKTLTATQLRSIIDHGLGESRTRQAVHAGLGRGDLNARSPISSPTSAPGCRQCPAPAVAIPQARERPSRAAPLYERYGCINCHGPNGLGGVPNPLSPDKTIPPLSGQDFRGEFNTDKKIIDFIRPAA